MSHMILQARPVCLEAAAGPDMKSPLHQLQDAVYSTGIGKGAEIPGTIPQDTPGHADPRIVVLQRYLDIGIGLIIAKHNIIMGMMLLDKRVFQDQRFHFIGYDDGFQIDSMADHGGYFDGPVGIMAYVAFDAVAQIDGLAHINDVTFGILP